jgi:hypothetical protein
MSDFNCKRHGKKWSISEVLNLQREYELLEWSVQQISEKHQRSVHSILFKLHAEGLTPSLFEATGYVSEKKTPLAKVVAKVTTKVLEEDVSDIDSSSDYEDNGDDVSDYDSEADAVSVDKNVNTLSDRVWNLETSVGEISTMVKQMFDQMTNKKKTKKLAPLRKHTI